MSQYLLSVHYVDGQAATSPEDVEAAYADVDKLNERMQKEGAWVFAGGLQSPEIATVVEMKDDQIVTTDGPFAEAKEQIGGFWVIEAASHEEAMQWAADATVACRAPVEVRPFQDEPAN